MKKIFKYPLMLGIPNTIRVPVGSNFRHFEVQDGILCVWVEVDTSKKREEVWALAIIGTGHEVPADCTYLATTQQGEFVWHLHRDYGL